MELDITSKDKGWKVSSGEEQSFLDGENSPTDIKKISDNFYHMIVKNKSYEVAVVGYDKATKKLDLTVNGSPYTYEIKDRYDQLLEQLGLDNLAAGGLTEIKAPMPGLVLDVLIEPGQTLEEGESMVILEAMKMENILKAPSPVTVKDIEVNKGETVDKNQILIRFES